MRGGSFSAFLVCLVGQRMHSARVDPAVVKIEQRAYTNRKIDGFVVPACFVQRFHIRGGDLRGIVIHLVDEAEQRPVLFVQSGAFQIL